MDSLCKCVYYCIIVKYIKIYVQITEIYQVYSVMYGQVNMREKYIYLHILVQDEKK